MVRVDLKEKIEGIFKKQIKTEIALMRARDLLTVFCHSPGYWSENCGNLGSLGTNAEGERYCGSLGVHHIPIGV